MGKSSLLDVSYYNVPPEVQHWRIGCFALGWVTVLLALVFIFFLYVYLFLLYKLRRYAKLISWIVGGTFTLWILIGVCTLPVFSLTLCAVLLGSLLFVTEDGEGGKTENRMSYEGCLFCFCFCFCALAVQHAGWFRKAGACPPGCGQ